MNTHGGRPHVDPTGGPGADHRRGDRQGGSSRGVRARLRLPVRRYRLLSGAAMTATGQRGTALAAAEPVA